MTNHIKSIHFELSNRCNASCPMCTRTNNPSVLNNPSDITYTSFKKFITPEILENLEQIKFCGNLGDPALCKDTLKIHEYITKHNPNIRLIFSTNGGIRSEEFWHSLSKYYITNPNSLTQFCIDGLSDTNHIYRVGVKWQKVMKNLQAFISGGGKAVWMFIPFFHNEHQVEKARELAKELGIDFIVKASARFDGVNKRNGIYPPTDPQYRADEFQTEGELKCVSKLRSEVYVDSFGRLFPCCWTATRDHIQNNSLHERDLYTIYNEFESSMGSYVPVCAERCTGSKIHVLEKDGQRELQKIFWK